MTKNGLLERLEGLLAEENAVYGNTEARHAVQEKIAALLKEIGDSKDLQLTLNAERLMLEHDLARCADPEAAADIKTALKDLAAALKQVEQLEDQAAG